MRKAYLDVYTPFGTFNTLIVDVNDARGNQAGWCFKSFGGSIADRETLINKARIWCKNVGFDLIEKVAT